MGHPGMGYPLSMGPSSVPPSIISGATTVRRARSVAEISHHGLAYSQPPTPGKKSTEISDFKNTVFKSYYSRYMTTRTFSK